MDDQSNCKVCQEILQDEKFEVKIRARTNTLSDAAPKPWTDWAVASSDKKSKSGWTFTPSDKKLICYDLFHWSETPSHRTDTKFKTLRDRLHDRDTRLKTLHDRDAEWDRLTRDGNFCAFCSHLRLGTLNDRRLLGDRLSGIRMSFFLGDFTTPRTKQHCMFCQLISRIIRRHSGFPDRETPTRARLEILCLNHRYLEIHDDNDIPISSLLVEDLRDWDNSWLLPDLPPRDPRPMLKTRAIDWNMISGMFKPQKGSELLEEQPPEFRVIDVKKGCIVFAPPLCEYVTLSYVWGNSPQPLQAMLSNIRELEQHGRLFEPDVPSTIKDAMDVCSHLNQKYLWVDRFCITQDDPSSRDAQINAMGSIYSHGHVTLVAVEGDAGFGLCGVSRERLFDLSFQNIRIKETNFGGPGKIKPNWKWMSRGWTLQESILSTRLLIFTEKSLFFKCSQTRGFGSDIDIQFYEDRESEGHPDIDLDLEKYIDMPPYKTTDTLYWYSRNVSDYTKRTLGNPQDILRAFNGIMCSLFGQGHLFGLPFAHFVEALLWHPMGHACLRKPRGENKFPTWSWASNTSPIKLQDSLLTVASCAIAANTAASGRRDWTVVSVNGMPTISFSNFQSGHLPVAIESAQKMALTGVEQALDWENNPFDRNIGSTEASLLKGFSLSDQCDGPPSCDRIAIHTQKVRLMLDPRTYQVSPGKNMVILRSSKFPAGFLFLDNTECEESIFPRLQDGEEIFGDFLALSVKGYMEVPHLNANSFDIVPELAHLKSRVHDLGKTRMLRAIGKALGFLCPEHTWLYKTKNSTFALNIMAIEDSNSGAFQRIGLGQVFLNRWVELNPEVGTFVIE